MKFSLKMFILALITAGIMFLLKTLYPLTLILIIFSLIFFYTDIFKERISHTERLKYTLYMGSSFLLYALTGIVLSIVHQTIQGIAQYLTFLIIILLILLSIYFSVWGSNKVALFLLNQKFNNIFLNITSKSLVFLTALIICIFMVCLRSYPCTKCIVYKTTICKVKRLFYAPEGVGIKCTVDVTSTIPNHLKAIKGKT